MYVLNISHLWFASDIIAQQLVRERDHVRARPLQVQPVHQPAVLVAIRPLARRQPGQQRWRRWAEAHRCNIPSNSHSSQQHTTNGLNTNSSHGDTLRSPLTPNSAHSSTHTLRTHALRRPGVGAVDYAPVSVHQGTGRQEAAAQGRGAAAAEAATIGSASRSSTAPSSSAGASSSTSCAASTASAASAPYRNLARQRTYRNLGLQRTYSRSGAHQLAFLLITTATNTLTNTSSSLQQRHAHHPLKHRLPRLALLLRHQQNESLAQPIDIGDDDVLNDVDREIELRADVEAKHSWNRWWHPLWLRAPPNSICAPEARGAWWT